MELLLIRHGQTDWNIQKKLQSTTNNELNDIGKLQAEKIRESLGNEKIDVIICSPLKRAIETAKIINKEKNLPFIIDDRISERDFGEFEGVSDTVLDLSQFWNYNQNKMYTEAENITTFFIEYMIF